MERELRESEQHYRLLFEANPHPMWVYDLETLAFLAVNDSAVRSYGYSREEFLSMTIKDIRPVEEIPALLKSDLQRKRETQRAGIWRHEKKDGSEIDAEIILHQLRFSGRDAVIVSANNVTERVRAEAERQVILDIIQSVNVTAHLDDLLKLIHESLKKILYAENCFVALNDPITGLMHFEFWIDKFDPVPEPRPVGVGFSSYVLSTGQPLLLTEELKSRMYERGEVEKSGTSSASWLGVPLRTPSSIIGVLVVQHYENPCAYTQRDLEYLSSVGGQIALAIERKRAEEALQKSEEEYRSIFDNATMGVYRSTLDGSLIRPNGALARMLGYASIEEISRCNLARDIYHDPEERARLIAERTRNGSAEGLEVLWKKKDGSPIWVHLNARAVSDDDGNIICFDGFVHDITQRVQAKEAQRDSERRFSQAFNASPQPMSITTLAEGRYVNVNDSFVSVSGYKREELIGHTSAELNIWPTPKARSELVSLLIERGSVRNAETQLRTRSGEFRVLLSSAELIELDGIRCILIASSDITERKRAEEALRESEERYHRLVEMSPDGIIIHRDGEIDFVNSAGVKLIGAACESEVIGKSVYDLIQPEYGALLKERITRLQEGQFLPPVEIKGRRLDGFQIECEVLSVPFTHKDQPAVQVVVRDITERKRAEQALQAANKRALTEYERLVERIAALGQTLGSARDLTVIFRALRDFAVVSVPCDGLVISLYEEEKETRRPAYCWVDQKEFDPEDLVDIPVRDGMTGRAIKSGSVVIDNDYQEHLRTAKPVMIGQCTECETPRSALCAPMTVMGRTVGCVEVQSYQAGVYTQEHATAMRMAANLAANAVENVTLIERERDREEQLRQSQKMEAIGKLAGGIAHDFNNLLTGITGYSELALRKLEADNPVRKNIEEIRKAGARAASLTGQLLAFSRRQMLQAKVLDLNAVVGEMDKLLRRLIGEDIDLITLLKPGLGQIKADPGQIEQVLMNLVVNARDAMPKGGKITIETEHAYLDEAYARNHLAVQPGRYVALTVSDTGTGMDTEIQKRIFDPFFTTKEVGKGTGLGLSTVYGIVKQSGGNIWVYSEVDKGTTFKVYLPRFAEALEEAEAEDALSHGSMGRETVLLVEDEEMVRSLAKEVLEENGYAVITALNGQEGLQLSRDFDGRIDLLITDVVMPQMGGRELAEALSALRPDTRVLYMSGYTDDAIVRHGILDDNTFFLQKPFTPNTLALKTREALDQSLTGR
jgi:PAS domain S-box-containing protein